MLVKGGGKLNTVEPIRDVKKINAMKKILRADSIRNYLLFVMGINTGLRISDLLRLTLADVVDGAGNIKDSITIREKKTNKEKKFGINKSVAQALQDYLQDTKNLHQDIYLFKSRKGENRPISRVQAYETLNKVARDVGITEEIGTHTLRKTMGYHARIKGVPIEVLQKIFNHSAPSITMRYIGITKDEIDDVYLNLNL